VNHLYTTLHIYLKIMRLSILIIFTCKYNLHNSVSLRFFSNQILHTAWQFTVQTDQKGSPDNNVNCLGILTYMNKCCHVFHHESQISTMLNVYAWITVRYSENGIALIRMRHQSYGQWGNMQHMVLSNHMYITMPVVIKTGP
jgi:hypothetical protein